MKIFITGATGFIGKNFCLALIENGIDDIIKIDIDSSEDEIIDGIRKADIIYHLAGINRPKSDQEFISGNVDFTREIVEFLKAENQNTPIVFSSSTQAENSSPYGKSKVDAENIIREYSEDVGSDYYIYRLPNVFGKWCMPNYNSFVATFCHNIANDLPIEVHNPTSEVDLVYIDDVCDSFLTLIKNKKEKGYRSIENTYKTTVGEVSEVLYKFKESRENLISERVGNGFYRALYATYISYLNPEKFSYVLEAHEDPRGSFCEFLKTKDSGQFSFFTAVPGISRGGHYHHTKSEKFLVVNGSAKFVFEHIVKNERFEIEVHSSDLRVVQSIPGWAHMIENTGDENLVVMLWANEIFNQDQPDTIATEI